MLEHTNYTDALRKEVVETVSRIPIEYNPEGWEKLSKQLDAELPVTKGGKTGFNMNGKWMRFGVLFTTALLVLSLTQGSKPISASTLEMQQKEVNRQIESEEATESKVAPNDSHTTNDQKDRLEMILPSKHAGAKSNLPQGVDTSLVDKTLTQGDKATLTIPADSLFAAPKTNHKEDSVFIFW